MGVTIRCLTLADLRDVDQLRAELGWNQTISAALIGPGAEELFCR
jgi:hypothetical protein